MDRASSRQFSRREAFKKVRQRFKSNVALADALGDGFSPSYVSQLLGGHRGIGDDVATKIEERLGLKKNFLDNPQGAISADRGLSSVPLLNHVPAGNWSEILDNWQPGDGEYVETSYHARRHTFALRVVGDSMEPRFPEGAILIVEPDEAAVPGKFVIVRQNGDADYTFKQLISDGGKMYLKPINPRYPIMEMLPDAVICGVVKKIEMEV